MVIDEQVLREMSRNASSALDLGKAAEHLVCVDLLLRGHRAYLSDQGLPYDVVVDVSGRLLRIQVKGACFPRDINKKGRHPIIRYNFDARRSGKRGRKRLDEKQCDLVAFVALDIGHIAYIPFAVAPQHMGILSPTAPRQTVLSRCCRFEEFPFSKAVDAIQNGNIQPMQSRRGKLIEHLGLSLTAKEWSAKTGISATLIHSRIFVGWPPSKAVSTPASEVHKRKLNPQINSPEAIAKRSKTHKQWWATKRALLSPALAAELPSGEERAASGASEKVDTT